MLCLMTLARASPGKCGDDRIWSAGELDTDAGERRGLILGDAVKPLVVTCDTVGSSVVANVAAQHPSSHSTHSSAHNIHPFAAVQERTLGR